MLKSFLVAGAALILASTVAQAQTVELYGGATVGGQDLNYGPVPPSVPNLVEMDPGFAAGAGMHWAIPNSSFEAGVDAMFTNQDYSTWGPGGNLQSLSLMATGRYVAPIPNANMTAYAGLGVGAINLTYSDTPALADGSDMIGGWQAEGGMRFNLGANEAFLGLRYQAGFNEALIQTESVEYNSLSVIGGIRF